MVNSSCLPPGRNCGRQWDRSPFDLSTCVRNFSVPPLAGTCRRPFGSVNTIVSSGPHAAPQLKRPLQSVIGVPPAIGIFFTNAASVLVENAIHWPSGEISGNTPSDEPVRMRGSNSSSRRSASTNPSLLLTVYTSVVPSRDNATKPARSLSAVRDRVTPPVSGGAALRRVSARPMAIATAAAAIVQGSARFHAGADGAAAIVVGDAGSGAPDISRSSTRLAPPR